MYEQPRIIVQRHEYLRRMRRNRREGRPVVYLDETWANARDSLERMWVEDDPVVGGGTIVGFRKPSGKGSRLIILHAGGEMGGLMVLLWYSKVRRQPVTTMMRCLQFILKSGSMIV